MRRLFWTFPDGLPGAGLFLMRLATSGAQIYLGIAEWQGQPLRLAEGLSAACLLVGLATPFWGVFTAAVELWRVFSQPGEFLVHALLAALGAALGLLGPGATSADARIFGWRRIDVAPPDATATRDKKPGSLKRSDW